MHVALVEASWLPVHARVRKVQPQQIEATTLVCGSLFAACGGFFRTRLVWVLCEATAEAPVVASFLGWLVADSMCWHPRVQGAQGCHHMSSA